MNCCDICGEKASEKVIDMWVKIKDNRWITYHPCRISYRCVGHDRDSIYKTGVKEVFNLLSNEGESVILI